jgi:hypothetical protein
MAKDEKAISRLVEHKRDQIGSISFLSGAFKDWQAICATPTPPCLHLICPGVVANVAFARSWLHKQTHFHDLRTVNPGAMSLNYLFIIPSLAVGSAWRSRHGHGASL